MTNLERHSLHSVLREVILEHLLIGELLRVLWRRGITDAEILRSEFDAGGYDLRYVDKTDLIHGSLHRTWPEVEDRRCSVQVLMHPVVATHVRLAGLA